MANPTLTDENSGPVPNAGVGGGSAEALRELEAALQRGDAAGVEALLPGLHADPAVPAEALDPVIRVLAHHHLGQHETARTAEAFARLAQPNDADQRLHTLARNLEVLRRHRPALFAQLVRRRTECPAMPYRFVRDGATGRMLMAKLVPSSAEQEGGRFEVVAPGGQFEAFVVQTGQTLAGKADQPLALLSIGDGYAVTHLAEHPPELFMDQAVAVHVIEPDVDRLIAALHLHDWSGESLPGGGPLRDERFAWYVGPDWESAFRAAWETDRWTPQPALAVCPDPTQTQALGTKLRDLANAFQERCASSLAQAKARYAARDEAAWAELFGPHPPRRPRMAVLTSRFTTVLQYAARDTAEALRRLGWEVEILIEAHPHERFNANVFGEMLRAFDPDALMSIDATRHDLLGWVPDELPYLCWIQDALPKLMNAELGGKLGPRDFVLTFFAPRLVNDHAYPARQCIDMPMMVTTPRGERGKQPGGQKDGPDFIYASNVSGTVASLREQSCGRAPVELRGLVEQACGLLTACYDDGGALPTEPDIDALLDRAVARGELPGHAPEARRALRDALWNPLNTGLYRQQALAWVVEAAEARGMTLHLHGRGWGDHPAFGRFDRGPLDHGALQAATAASRFALHLEPYVCYTHHRMLDATQCGTPVLVRDHPGNLGMPAVAAFLASSCPEAQSDGQARDALRHDADRTAELEALLRDSRGLTWDMAGDVVAQVRAWQRAGVLREGADTAPPLPHLEVLTFSDAASLGERVDGIRGDPEQAQAVLRAQQAAIEDGLTFDAAMRRVVSRVYGLLIDV